MIPLLCTQVYCFHDRDILLMRRHKEPNLGLWVAPGGKIEYYESPQEGAVRELREETGLVAAEIHLRGIVSLILPDLRQPCLHFLYAVPTFTGELLADEREGRLQWWPVDTAAQLPMPPANACFLQHVLTAGREIYQARYVYDEQFQIVACVEHGSRLADRI